MPLLGQFPSYINWLISSAAALFGWIITLMLYGHYKKRIAYWL
jgi:lipopolysaccharide transport system permease protein